MIRKMSNDSIKIYHNSNNCCSRHLGICIILQNKKKVQRQTQKQKSSVMKKNIVFWNNVLTKIDNVFNSLRKTLRAERGMSDDAIVDTVQLLPANTSTSTHQLGAIDNRFDTVVIHMYCRHSDHILPIIKRQKTTT